MTKESTNVERLKNLDFEGESWGVFLKAVESDVEKKEYMHLVNALYAAAKFDIKQERNETNQYMYKQESGDIRHDKYTQGFDAVIDGIFNNMNLDKIEGFDDGARKSFIKENKDTLKKQLQVPYAKLKNSLYDVRVFGTGNSNGEKLAQALKLCAKACITVLEPMLVIGAGITAYMGIGLAVAAGTPLVLAAPFVLGAAAAVGMPVYKAATRVGDKLSQVNETMMEQIAALGEKEKRLLQAINDDKARSVKPPKATGVSIVHQK